MGKALLTDDGLPISRYVRPTGEVYYAVKAVYRIKKATELGWKFKSLVDPTHDWQTAKITVKVYDKDGNWLCTEEGGFFFIDRNTSFINAGVTITKSRALASLGIGVGFPDEIQELGGGEFASAEEIEHFLAKTGNLLEGMISNPAGTLKALEKAEGPEEAKAALAKTIRGLSQRRKTQSAVKAAAKKGRNEKTS